MEDVDDEVGAGAGLLVHAPTRVEAGPSLGGGCRRGANRRRAIRFLGIEGASALIREPEGNGCAERLIRC